MNTATRLHRQGQQHITGLAHTVKELWGKMCEDVGIPGDSKFVLDDVLKESKYYQFYDQALLQYWAAIAEYQAGGYVGLKIAKPNSPDR